MSSPFRIIVLDANGNRISNGEIASVIEINDTKSLDKTGSLTFSMPAADPKSVFIEAGTQFDVYDEKDGYLGRYFYRKKRLTDNNGLSTLEIECFDALIELSRYSVNFFRNYTNQDVGSVIEDLVSEVPNWTALSDSEIGNTTISYQGESVFNAIDQLRDRWGKHFRLSNSRVLEFGSFGNDCGVRLIQISAAIPHKIDNKKEIGIIDSLSFVNESDEIFNYIIPLGFGQGVSQLTIENAVLGDYPIETGVNSDGSSFYYIKDDNSINQYGRRTRVLNLPNIRPLTNSDANIVNAANSLKLTAETYMSKHLFPKVEYQVSVKHLQKNIKVGDKIRIVYRGIVDGYKYIDIDEYFYVMDISKTRSVTGSRTYSLNITSVDDRRTSNTDVIIDIVRDLRNLNIHIPATLAYSVVGAYTKRIKGDGTPANRINPVFTARIKEEVLYLNRAILRFKTDTLKSSVTTTESGGGSVTSAAAGGNHTHVMFQGGAATIGTGTRRNFSPAGANTIAFEFITGTDNALTTFGASGDHTHNVTIPAHTHNMNYGIFNDTEYPQNIGLLINEVDVTSEIGGLFQANNSEFEIEIDVTDYLVNASGGLRRNHTFEFYCEAGRGEIEFELDMLVTIQPIAVE